MQKTICLTVQQAQTALACVDSDIAISEMGDRPDYSDTCTLTFYLNRAELRQRLATALNNLGGNDQC